MPSNHPVRMQPAPLSKVTTAAYSYSGPIPSAEALAKYKEVLPDAPERILAMAERQAAHRQELEKQNLRADVLRSYFGVGCAFAITMTGLILGYLLINSGHTLVGSIFAGGSFTGLVSTFIYGTHSRRQEREQKEKAVQAITKR